MGCWECIDTPDPSAVCFAGALATNGVVNMWNAMAYYDAVPGPFTPEFPNPPKGYDPDFNGVDIHPYPTVLAVLLRSFISVAAAAWLA